MSEGHWERGRGAEEEGAARGEKGCRGGGRKVSRRQAESRRKGLSVGGEQRPNRSRREGSWKEEQDAARAGSFWNPDHSGRRTEDEQATEAHGGTRDPTALGVPGSKPRFLPLLPSRGPESPSAAAHALSAPGIPKPAQPNLPGTRTPGPWPQQARRRREEGRRSCPEGRGCFHRELFYRTIY